MLSFQKFYISKLCISKATLWWSMFTIIYILIESVIYAITDLICLLYYNDLGHLFKLLQHFRVHLLWFEHTIVFLDLSIWISIEFIHSIFITEISNFISLLLLLVSNFYTIFLDFKILLSISVQSVSSIFVLFVYVVYSFYHFHFPFLLNCLLSFPMWTHLNLLDILHM